MHTTRFIGLFLLVLAAAFPGTRADAGVTITYLHSDALGSPVAATDQSGDPVWRASYLPFGEERLGERAAFGVRAGFTGHREDPRTGLVYMGARHYAPRLGRFLGVDPAGIDPGDPHSFNRYAYANNNPYRFVDPDGAVPLDTVWDALNVVYDLGKAGVGYVTGNAALVTEGMTDAAADTAALFIPYLPAGTSKLARLQKFDNPASDTQDILVLGRMEGLEALARREGGRLSSTPSSVPKEIYKKNAGDIRKADRIIFNQRDVPKTLEEALEIGGGQFARAERALIQSRDELLEKTMFVKE